MKQILFIALIALPAFLDPFADRVSKGNEEYGSSKFAEAEKSYNDAEDYAPSSKKAELAFNKGNARYKQNDYDGAIDLYRKAIESKDKNVQKKALFNIGNAYLQKNDKKSAADAYMAALRLDPQYQKAKSNLEYIYRQQKDEKKDKNKNSQNRQDQKDKKNGNGAEKQSSNPQQNKKSLDASQLDRMMEMMKNKPLRREKNDRDGSTVNGREKPW